MSFTDLKLIKPLILALEKKGYTQPTPIQQQSIPQILDGKDVFGCAQTGTGKTAAFALPILQHLYQNKGTGIAKPGIPKVLVLAPTRELATQINESFSQYGSGLGFRQALIFGGVNQRPQAETIRRGVDIIIACPGRLLDLMNQGYVRLDAIEHFVLDEAD